ncbi:HD family phosphohydrolase, partial [bacterium]|nr:HD family phosphohydrolase [bacterium]
MRKNKNENNIQQIKTFLLESPSILWLILILITFAFTITNYSKQSNILKIYNIGDIAARDIKAPRNFFVEDKKATNLKVNEIKEAVKKVYDFDPNFIKDVNVNLDDAMNIGRKLFIKADKEGFEPDPTFAIMLDTKPAFEDRLGIGITKGAYSVFYKSKFSLDINLKIKSIINKILTNGIVANKEVLLIEEHKGIILQSIGSKEERTVNNLKIFYSPDQAKAMVRIVGQPILNDVNYNLSNLIVDVCQRLLQPNITLNRKETEKRINDAVLAIKPVLYKIKAGEMILREGERVDKVHQVKLFALKSQAKEKNILISSIGIALITFLSILIIYTLFLKDHKKLKTDHNKHIMFLALGLVLYLVFVKASIYIAQSANFQNTWDISSIAFFMIIPVPAAAMLTCLFLGFDIAIFFAIILSLLTSLSFSGSFEVFIFFFLSSSIAAFWIKEKQEWNNFILAGFKLAIFNAILAI